MGIFNPLCGTGCLPFHEIIFFVKSLDHEHEKKSYFILCSASSLRAIKSRFHFGIADSLLSGMQQ